MYQAFLFDFAPLCYMLLGTGTECEALLLMGSMITVISNSYYREERIRSFPSNLKSLQLGYE